MIFLQIVYRAIIYIMSRIIEFDEFNVEKLDDELPLNEEVKVVEVKKRNFRKKLLLDPKTGVAKEVL